MEGVEVERGFRVKTLSSFHYSNGPILAVCLKEGSSLLAFSRTRQKYLLWICRIFMQVS